MGLFSSFLSKVRSFLSGASQPPKMPGYSLVETNPRTAGSQRDPDMDFVVGL